MAKEDVVKEFTSLKGLGKTKAELLYSKGFTSMDKLKTAKVSDLTKIKGINEKNAKEILDQIKDTGKKEPAKAKTPKKTEEKKKPVKKAAPKKKKETKPSAEEKKKPAEKKEEEEVEIVEETEEAYKVKRKPELSKELQELLTMRKQIKKRTPEFLREEWFRYKRIPKNWRRPDGITSKMRINLKYRPSKVRVGFRGPKEARGLHPSGFEEVIVCNVKELESINPKTQAARISSTVGTKKRGEIAKQAEKLEIRILNMKV